MHSKHTQRQLLAGCLFCSCWRQPSQRHHRPAPMTRWTCSSLFQLEPGKIYFMTNLKLFLITCSAAFALLGLNASQVAAESPSDSAQNGRNEEPLQIIVDLGLGQRKVRESHHGVVDPVAIPAGQQVSIMVRFLPTLAGGVALVSALDGGEVTVPAVPTIARDGTFIFQFRTGNLPGSYRLLVNGVRQYQLSIYSYDPNNRPRRMPKH